MNKVSKIIIWILSFQIIGFLIGMLTKQDIASWYIHLNKSPLNPPQLVFPIAWSLLYVTIAIAGFLIFDKQIKSNRSTKIFYVIQLIMNWLWTPIFFTFHQITLGFIWILWIAFFTLLTIIFAYKTSKTASLILLPYFIWLIFASYLNYYILVFN